MATVPEPRDSEPREEQGVDASAGADEVDVEEPTSLLRQRGPEDRVRRSNAMRDRPRPWS